MIDATDFFQLYISPVPEFKLGILKVQLTSRGIIVSTRGCSPLPFMCVIYIQSCVRLDMRYSAESKYIAMAMHVCVQVSVLQCLIIAHVGEDMYTDSG